MFSVCLVVRKFCHIFGTNLVCHCRPGQRSTHHHFRCRARAPPTANGDGGGNVDVDLVNYWTGVGSPSSVSRRGCTEGRDSIRVPRPRLTYTGRTCKTPTDLCQFNLLHIRALLIPTKQYGGSAFGALTLSHRFSENSDFNTI